MPAIDGGQVAATMKHIKPSVPILMLSGLPRVPEQDLAHIDAFIQKGQEPAVVLQQIEQTSVAKYLCPNFRREKTSAKL